MDRVAARGQNNFCRWKIFLGWSGKLLGLVAKSFYSGGDKNFCHPPLKIVSPHPPKIFCHVTPKIVCYPIPPFFPFQLPKNVCYPTMKNFCHPTAQHFSCSPTVAPSEHNSPVLVLQFSYIYSHFSCTSCKTTTNLDVSSMNPNCQLTI